MARTSRLSRLANPSLADNNRRPMPPLNDVKITCGGARDPSVGGVQSPGQLPPSSRRPASAARAGTGPQPQPQAAADSLAPLGALLAGEGHAVLRAVLFLLGLSAFQPSFFSPLFLPSYLSPLRSTLRLPLRVSFSSLCSPLSLFLSYFVVHPFLSLSLSLPPPSMRQ